MKVVYSTKIVWNDQSFRIHLHKFDFLLTIDLRNITAVYFLPTMMEFIWSRLFLLWILYNRFNRLLLFLFFGLWNFYHFLCHFSILPLWCREVECGNSCDNRVKYCLTAKTTAVGCTSKWETGVSRHHGAQLRAPSNPCVSLPYRTRGLKGCIYQPDYLHLPTRLLSVFVRSFDWQRTNTRLFSACGIGTFISIIEYIYNNSTYNYAVLLMWSLYKHLCFFGLLNSEILR